MRVAIGFLYLLVLGASVANAQDGASISGIVRDAATARPLIGALVTIQTSPTARTTRTDQSGAYFFANVAPGKYTLSIRVVGYEPLNQQVDVVGAAKVDAVLKQLAALDTVRVRDVTQRIYGVVATSEGLRPLPDATVQVIGMSSGQVTADSTGHFSYAVRTPGAYVVRGKFKGLGTTSVSVVVQSKSAVEVALLLDSVPEVGANALEMAYSNFHDRLLRRGSASVVLSRSELMAHEQDGLIGAILGTHTFGSKAMRFNDAACVFIDGRPQPGVSPNSIDVASVEAVEVYAIGADRSLTLAPLWPKQAPCGDTGMARLGVPRGASANGSGLVQWVVVWMKR